ncbi:MAG TPA: hypothetical protein V6D09_09035 [Leptolyngbyaceae cyanobacterium]
MFNLQPSLASAFGNPSGERQRAYAKLHARVRVQPLAFILYSTSYYPVTTASTKWC